jgi:hypothetical protein
LESKFHRPGEPLSETEQQKLKELFKEFGGFSGSWTKTSVQERIGLVKASWDAEVAEQLSYVFEVIQRQNNTLLHSSPTAYGLAMSPGRRMINRAGPDQRWRDAISHGSLGFYLVLRVIAEEFGFDRGRAESLFERAGHLSYRFTDEELAAVPAGAPCPCGSGAPVELVPPVLVGLPRGR